jgi:hypothetical protein
MNVTFRPMPMWPHPTRQRRTAPFRASYSKTLDDLAYEIDRLRGSSVIVGAGFAPDDIRLDGLPRAKARPTHPGIEVSFDTPNRGRLVFAVDTFDQWDDNLRAVALGLEALRAVERYGIADMGQQYAGFAQLAAGESKAERGRRLVVEAGGVTEALKRHHPDHGGEAADFDAVMAYRAQA